MPAHWQPETRTVGKKALTVPFEQPLLTIPFQGALAQLVERLHGMQEVVGSSPIGSTIKKTGRLLTKAAGSFGRGLATRGLLR